MKKLCISLLFCTFLGLMAQAQQMAAATVPANIKAAAQAKAEGLPITDWTLDKRRERWVATILSEQTFKNILIGLDGAWIRSTEALLPQKVPAAVMATLKSRFVDKGYKASNYTFVQEPGNKNFYTAEVSSEDAALKIRLDARGTILQQEDL